MTAATSSRSPGTHPVVAHGHSAVRRHPLLESPTFRARVLSEFEAYKREHTVVYPQDTWQEMAALLDAGNLWFQSLFTVLPSLWELASHPSIVEPVKEVLGPDVLLWSSTVLVKPPGDVHCWHIDTARWQNIGAWVGIDGINPGSVLRLLTSTNHLGAPPFEELQGGEMTDIRDVESILADDAAVLAEARRLSPGARMVVPEMTEGDFFLFDGDAWHSSNNTSSVTRTAVTFFYARPDAEIRVPMTFGRDPHWHPEPPPCVLVAGEDRYQRNKLVTLPLRSG